MNYLIIIAVSGMLFLMVSCGGHSESSIHSGGKKDHGHGFMKSLPESIVDSVIYDEDMKALMDDLQKVLVNLPRNENLTNKQEHRNVETFVLTRANHITSFPCSNCHTDLSQKLSNREADAHWNIKLNHATKSIMNCNSCHDLENPDQLISLGKSAIDFDHSYQMCAQCHSSQAKDWLGGAHGKRAGGWVNPRIINSCVSCHNPHDPKIPSRWPARLNTVKLLEQNK